MRRFVASVVVVVIGVPTAVISSLGNPAIASPGAAPTRGYHRLAVRYAPDLPATATVVSAGSSVRVDLSTVVPGSPGVAIPAAATHALVSIWLAPVGGREAVLYAHACVQPPDRASGGIVRVLAGATSASNEVIVPLADRSFCVTPSADASFVVLAQGYVLDDADGLAYVDIHDEVLFDDRVPRNLYGSPQSVPISTASAGLPAGVRFVAISLSGYAAVYPGSDITTGVGPSCGATAATSLLTMSGRQLFAAVSLMVPVEELRCLNLPNSDLTLTVLLTGYYMTQPTASASSPPEFRFVDEGTPRFVAHDPTRLFDTRAGAGARLGQGAIYEFDLAGAISPNATAVAMNVTATDAAGPGFVTVYACSDERPVASNLNLVRGADVPNAVVVGLGRDARLCFFVSTGTHLVADLSGWFERGTGAGLVPTDPVRVFDTRTRGQAIPAAGDVAVDVSAFVAADATAVALNVTVTEPTSAGFLTVYPCGVPRPLASSLNYAAGQTVANLVLVKLPADKRVCFFTQSRTHALADVSGSFSPASSVGLVSGVPTRLFDTRDDGAPLVPRSSDLSLGFYRSEVAWLMNVTVTEPRAPGFLTVHPCQSGVPLASNVNFVAAQTVPNLVLARPDAFDRVCFFNQEATHYLADLFGYFVEQRFWAELLPGSDAA